MITVGNNKIKKIKGFKLEGFTTGSIVKPKFTPINYKTVYVGDEFVWPISHLKGSVKADTPNPLQITINEEIIDYNYNEETLQFDIPIKKHIESMHGMCDKIAPYATTIDTSELITPYNTILNGAFEDFTNLDEITLNFDTSKVVSLTGMFSDNKARKFDLSNCDFSSSEIWYFTFGRAINAEEIIFPHKPDMFKNVTDIHYMFEHCEKIKTLDLSDWVMPKCEVMNLAFSQCFELETLNLKNWDFSGITNPRDAFYKCKKLANIIGPVKGIRKAHRLVDCPLTNESAMVIINGMDEITDAQTMSFNPSTYNTLTKEQIAIATSKGWTITNYY